MTKIRPLALLPVLALGLSAAQPARAARMDYYSKLDLPVYAVNAQATSRWQAPSLYIGSDKSYAAEPKAVRVAGRSFTLGLAIAGLLQPLGPLVAAGFLLVGVYNAGHLAERARYGRAERGGLEAAVFESLIDERPGHRREDAHKYRRDKCSVGHKPPWLGGRGPRGDITKIPARGRRPVNMNGGLLVS
jgi:hypothetical protein